MKHNYLLIFSLCLTTFAWAAESLSNEPVRNAHRVISSALEDNPANLDSICYFDSNNVLTQKNIYTYDASGNELSELVQKVVNGELENYTKRECTYDINGNMINENRYKWSSAQWVINYTDTSVYTAGLKMSFIKFELHDVTWWGSREEYSYSVTSEGMVRTAMTSGWTSPNGSWTLGGKRVDTYRLDGKLSLSITYILRDEIWVPDTKDERFYDNYGNETDYCFSQWNSFSQDWTYIIKNHQTYDDSGYSLTFETYRWEDEHWMPAFSRNFFTYEDDYHYHCMTSYFPTYDSSETWNLGAKTEWYLDEDMRVTSCINSDYLNNQWVYSRKTEYIYEDCGNYHVIYYNWNNDQWVVSSSVYYYYVSNSTDIVSTSDSTVNTHKFIRNGVIVIEKNGIFYDLMGNVLM